MTSLHLNKMNCLLILSHSNVISEFIMGYMQPGKPLALMLFKSYGYVTAAQALAFVGDLKL